MLLKNKLSKKYKKQSGLTLVEIIVVLIILSAVMGFLASKLFSKAGTAKAKINELSMARVKGYIEQYQLQYNNFPSDLNSLTGCGEAQSGAACVPIADESELRDSWGTPYIYSTDSGRGFTLKSLGADKKSGGSGVDADVTITGP